MTDIRWVKVENGWKAAAFKWTVLKKYANRSLTIQISLAYDTENFVKLLINNRAWFFFLFLQY
jgi:hypothetical protein